MNSIQENDYWSEVAVKSGLFPDKTNIFQIKAIIEIGRSIGLPPFQALRSISFIKGKVNMEVAAQLALFRKAGGKIVKIESTHERAYVELEYEGQVYPSEFTIADADNMGLTNPKTKDGKEYKGAYEKYPAIMLIWRAIGNRLKYLVPDLTMGLYAKDELASFLTDVEPAVVDIGADDFILETLNKDIQVANKLKYLNYSRRQAINIYKDFDGNIDRIDEVLVNEIKQIEKEKEVLK